MSIGRWSRLLLTICMCLGWIAQIGAQDINLRFTRIDRQDGLSQSTVRRIVQDAQGFMWFGTHIGLNRYDGYSMTRFKHDQRDQNSLSNDCITALMTDDDGRLWVGTLRGLDRFHVDTQSFSHYRHDPADPLSLPRGFVNAICQSVDGLLWVDTDPGGLCRFDVAQGRFQREFDPTMDDTRRPVGEISALCMGSKNTLWLGTIRGRVHRYDWHEKRLETFELFDEDTAETATISAILKTDNGIWVAAKATQPLGVFKIEPYTGDIETFASDSSVPSSLGLRHVNAMFQDADATLWFGGAQRGLARLNPDVGVFSHYRHQRSNPFSLSDNTVFTVYQDRGGNIWVGTNSGVCRMNPLSEVFHHHCHLPSNPNSLSHNRVKAVQEGKNDTVWIGTYGGGLNRLDRKSGRMTAYRHDPEDGNSLSSDNVFAVYCDDPEGIWIGTFGGGLNRLDHETETFAHFRSVPGDALSIRSDLVVTLASGPEGTLWVGTRDGLDLFDPATGSCRQLNWRGDGAHLEQQFIRAITTSRDGTVWIGTFLKGLFKCDLTSMNVEQYCHDPEDPQSLGHDYVACILEDSRGRFWLGTGGGLHLFHPHTGESERITDRNGLPDNMIYGVLEAANGCLWLSTSNGLCCFDPVDRSVKIFDARDGLQGQEFNSGAYCKTRDGQLIFGGTNGFNLFDPEDIVANQHIPNVVFTCLKKLNEEVGLETHVSLVPEIVMGYQDKVFTLEFAALDFADPSRNQYAYFLKGFHKNWVHAGTKREATFTNLDPGRYVFRVMGSNSDGLWNDQPSSIPITVLPPPWKSWWAYCLYGLGLVSMVMGILYAYHRKIEYENAVKLEAHRQLERKVAERTRELAERNVDLDVKNRELETLDRIVRTINREVDFSKVIHCLLDQGMLLFPHAKSSSFLSFDQDERCYRYTESIGYDAGTLEATRLDREDLEARYLNKPSIVNSDIRVVDHGPQSEGKGKGLDPDVQSRLILTIRYGEEIEGLLLFDLTRNARSFSATDTEKARRFKEHAVSAVVKAKTLNDLVEAQKALVDSAHVSGMAEVATNVLHNVGNVLNSVMVSSQTIDEMVRTSRLNSLAKANAVLRDNLDDLTGFLAENPKGKRLIEFYFEIERVLKDQERIISINLADLLMEIEIIREVITAQQRYATGTFQTELLPVHRVVEDAIRIQKTALDQDAIAIIREYEDVPEIPVQKTKLIHIIINLLENAREAMANTPKEDRVLTVSIERHGECVHLKIRDSGEGIHPDDLDKIFRHGFTTRKEGFGFGLHSCANAMIDMGGRIRAESEGPGCGATLILRFPIKRHLAQSKTNGAKSQRVTVGS